MKAETKNRRSYRQKALLRFLLSVLEFSSFVPAIENVLGTLLSLAETQENRFAIAEAGAVPPSLLSRLVKIVANIARERHAKVLPIKQY